MLFRIKIENFNGWKKVSLPPKVVKKQQQKDIDLLSQHRLSGAYRPAEWFLFETKIKLMETNRKRKSISLPMVISDHGPWPFW